MADSVVVERVRRLIEANATGEQIEAYRAPAAQEWYGRGWNKKDTGRAERLLAECAAGSMRSISNCATC